MSTLGIALPPSRGGIACANLGAVKDDAGGSGFVCRARVCLRVLRIRREEWYAASLGAYVHSCLGGPAVGGLSPTALAAGAVSVYANTSILAGQCGPCTLTEQGARSVPFQTSRLSASRSWLRPGLVRSSSPQRKA